MSFVTKLFSKNPILISNFNYYKRNYAEMAKKALVFLGPGAEEMEAVIAIDVLRRAGIEVTVAGIPGPDPILCSRGVKLCPDKALSELVSLPSPDVLVLPGGLGGTEAMIKSEDVGTLLKRQESEKKLIAAICAAPTALKAHGVCVGKTVTSYPSMEKQMVEGGKYVYKHDDVVFDENLITSRGPGTAYKFALAIVEKLVNKEKALEVAKALLYNY